MHKSGVERPSGHASPTTRSESASHRFCRCHQPSAAGRRPRRGQL